ncbi:hypothetical protein ACFYVR_21985 [Rhodococcus sp. NPDC003318]|uniref:hypothetical protein n=1 Tax=Rhodococcus sp. NPDC003318 TaxID=3364503 RepID=UPI00367F19BD
MTITLPRITRFARTTSTKPRPTIAMAITNTGAAPIHLVDHSPGFGWWRAAPPATIAPHTTAIVTATTQDPGGTVSATYQLPDGARARFAANNFGSGVDLDDTDVDGPWRITRALHAGFPDLSATYALGTP